MSKPVAYQTSSPVSDRPARSHEVLEPLSLGLDYSDNSPEGILVRQEVVAAVTYVLHVFNREVSDQELLHLMSRAELRNAAKHLYAVLNATENDLEVDVVDGGEGYIADAVSAMDCYDIEVGLAKALRLSLFELQAANARV